MAATLTCISGCSPTILSAQEALDDTVTFDLFSFTYVEGKLVLEMPPLQ